MNDTIIHDGNFQQFIDTPVDGQVRKRGLIPRNYEMFGRGCYGAAQAIDIPIIPRSEWPDRIREKENDQNRLSDIRNTGNSGGLIPSLDQNGKGYCWTHSVVQCVHLLRAYSNQPYVPLSAYSVACVIKTFRDEGGWGALALDFIATRGIATQSDWPQQSMSRNHNTPETWERAKNYRTTEGWIDLAEPVYDRNLTFDQVASLLLVNIPVVLDYNWWGHSVCGMDLVDLEPNRQLNDVRRWGVRILNSWSDNWENKGTAVLAGTKAVPDGAVAPRVVFAA